MCQTLSYFEVKLLVNCSSAAASGYRQDHNQSYSLNTVQNGGSEGRGDKGVADGDMNEV